MIKPAKSGERGAGRCAKLAMDGARRFTDDLVSSTKQYTGLEEQDAVVLVGVSLGVLISAACAAVMYVLVRGVCRRSCGSHMDTGKSSAESGIVPVSPPADSSNTEGCYRSSTDSDDEGQGATTSRIAQKRSKRCNRIS